jgi:ribosome biogenesis GTPase
MSDARGTVIAVRPQWVVVQTQSSVIACDVPVSLLRGERSERSYLAVGDRVAFAEIASDRGVVTERETRTTRISRRVSVRPPREQVLAANVDQLLAIQSIAEPRWNPRALDRLLVVGEVGGVRCAVCVNKIDLAGPGRADELAAVYRQIGYSVFLTSAARAVGIEPVADFLHGRLTVFLGSSGVGKSTLLNRLVPGAVLATASISSATGKGRHTTARTDYLALPGSGAVLDTPGLRAIQPWTTPAGLAAHFPELRPFLGRCRFSDCLHRTEPSCGVRAAASSGQVNPARYDSYLRILEGLEADEA